MSLNKIKKTAEQILKILRLQQKKHIECGEEISGLEMLNEMVQQGAAPASFIIDAREAIINYNTPFNLIVK
jgi:hypothetical protein